MSAEVGQEESKPDINGMKMEKPNDNQNRNPDNRRGGYGGRGGRFNGNQRGKPGDMKGADQQGGPMGGGEMQAEGGGRPQGRGGYGGGRGNRFKNQGNQRGSGGDMAGSGGGSWPNETAVMNDRLLKTVGSSTLDIPPQEYKEKKFNSRCRLYIGNLPADVTEDELKTLFAPYGETSELYINKEKNFAFIRLDYRSTAEKAKRELDGHTMRNRNLRVRFAPLGSTVKVKNLTPYVTNELLEVAFSVFGGVERAMVNVDERGNSLKEGYVIFTRKTSAQSALRHCAEGCFFLTSSLKPVILEPFELAEDSDGFSEKNIAKKGPEFFEARETGPRFAKAGSFEYEFGTRWKQIHELYKQKEETLEREMKLEEEKLEAQLKYAKYEHETELLREQLRQREMDRERQKREWELKERQAEEQRVAEEEALRRQQEEISRRMLHHEDELRRRQQENSLFMQSHQMNSLMDQPESTVRPGGYKDTQPPLDYEADPAYNYEGGQRGAVEANYMDMGYSRSRGYEGARQEMDEMGSRRPTGGRWAHQERRGQEDFPNKRRRY